MKKQAVILAGGAGTRLRERLGDLPKPMIPIGGKPLLEHQVELAKRHGCSDIVIFAGYRAEVIQSHFGDGSRWGLKLSTIVEHEPLGTAGAVLAGFDRLADDFVVMYGDTMVSVDLERIWQAHVRARADATLLLHPNDHPLDSDLVEVNAEGWITAFHNRPHPAGCWFQNLVNAGLYVINKRALQPFCSSRREKALTSSQESEPPYTGCYAGTQMDFGQDLFPAMLRRGAKLSGYNSPEYIKDIGAPERYDRVCAEYTSGLVQRSSLAVPQPAVFLDRDGTLNEEVGGVTLPDQLKLLPGVAEAIQQLNHQGFRVIVVTNQPVVAKGFCTEGDVQTIHNKLETLLGGAHAFLDRIYFCPHHPEKGFAGERPELKMNCDCRKPKPGQIQRAAKDLNLDLKTSWFVGDSTTDIETAKNAGLKSILVRTGHAGCDAKFAARPDFVFDNLPAAVHFILEQR